MGTDHRRRAVRGGASLLCAARMLLYAVQPAAAAPPWWQPVALAGVRVSAVAASATTVLVQVPSGVLESQRGGPFVPVPSQTALTPPLDVVSGGITWQITPGGEVLTGPAPVAGRSAANLHPDPGAPHLGAGAHLLAAPSATPGVVVAVSAGNVVWRRGQDGDWRVALLLLPGGGLGGVPAVTGLTAFTQPIPGGVTDAVYLATDGYSVLISTDGGDDWIRAGPGLPDSVLDLASDAQTGSVYAATADGLWVHVLQELPGPPVYRDAALVWRWIGIVLVSLAAAALGGLGIRMAARRLAA